VSDERDNYRRLWPASVGFRLAPASVDTLPKGQDAKQGLAGTEGSAVGSEADETPSNSNPPQGITNKNGGV
jgi:hypothetical protein